MTIRVRHFIIYFFVIRNVFANDPDGPNKADFEFEVELLTKIGIAIYPSKVQKVKPPLPEDPKIRYELCIAAKNYLSFKFENSAEDPWNWVSGWGRPHYLDASEANNEEHSNVASLPTYFHYMFCDTKPTAINLRATDTANKFVIAIDNINDIKTIYYAMTNHIQKFIFKIKIVEADPIQNANAGELKKNASEMENDELQKVHERMKFMDWIHICLKAKEHIRYQNSLNVKSAATCSPAGLRSIKVYTDKTGAELENVVVFRCPNVPTLLYVYFSDLRTVTIVLVLET